MKMTGKATSVRGRSLCSALVAVAAVAVLWTIPAWAGFGVDRPDLLDISEAFYSEDGSIAAIYARAAGALYDERVHGQGRRTVYTVADGKVELHWYIYEPDKMNRKSDGAKLKQKDYVAFFVKGTTTATFFAIGPEEVAGCKAQISSKGAPLFATAKWKVKCDSNILDSLGLNAAQKNAFVKAFGTDNITDISGKGAAP